VVTGLADAISHKTATALLSGKVSGDGAVVDGDLAIQMEPAPDLRQRYLPVMLLLPMVHSPPSV